MASLFTHALVAASLGQAAPPVLRASRRFWGMAVVCSMLPDIDVVGFRIGVPYGDLWGHRGITHSLFFAAVVAAVLAAGFSDEPAERWRLGLMLFIITASHGVLDALTNGGLGVAFFSPFNPERYFFPWRPIQVSPISAVGFFSLRGLHVLLSEIVWLWGPALVLAAVLRATRYYFNGPPSQTQVDLQEVDH